VGDFTGAEVTAERVLRANDPGKAKHLIAHRCPHGRLRNHRLCDAAGRVRRLLGARLQTGSAGHTPIELWDAHTVLRCCLTDFSRIIDGPARLAEWFGIQRDTAARTLVITAGRSELRLDGLVEHWHASAHTLLAEAHTPDGSQIRSHVTLRQAMLPNNRGVTEGVEVWVHIEFPASKRGKKLLAALKPTIEAGIQRLEAAFDAP
jgi:hypothetical protein